MQVPRVFRFSRRSFLAASGSAAVGALLPTLPGRTGSLATYRLVARPGRTHLVGETYPETAVWSYNGTVPGPEIRVRQGERLHITVENQLGEETTVHWHGLRVPNPMDGVPHLTQRLIVEERQPIEVDRDLTWVLDDWRLLPDAQISDDFGNFMDSSHNGRVGNSVTVNGRIQETFAVRAGERLRLRLINAANARIFGLEFRDHRPTVVALDGQPVEPHEPEGGRVVLGPAMRAVEADVGRDLAGVDARPLLELDVQRVGLGGSSAASRRLLLEVAVGKGLVHGRAVRQGEVARLEVRNR
ncbi:MAG: copper oxidase [Geminicoccaceae bacterium]|nr:copper oxidase [Geminicoccaceae bacterium]